MVYAQAERPLRAEDLTGVASVYARGYFLDRTNVKTYCLFLPRQAAFYLVRYVIGAWASFRCDRPMPRLPHRPR